MPTLYLLRHAKSSWDEPSLADRDRPLSARGRNAAGALAGFIESTPARIAPSLVLCSPARRAVETLEQIRASLGEQAQVMVEEDLYGATAGDLLHRLRSVPEGTDPVMLIGHNPAIQELALGIARGGNRLEQLRGKFPTGALATLAIPGPWRGLVGGSGELQALVVPRDLP
jgi:phosphohistidine phosphatase